MDLPLDIYPIIVSHLDWFTLLEFKKINSFTYFISKKEINNRINSDIPLSDPNAKISITTYDINLESISLIIDNKYILIPKERYHLSWIQNSIDQWFIFSLKNHGLILTGKLFKSIIRILNKNRLENLEITFEKYQELIFSYNNEESILEKVILV
jgi:hypothetical protein